MTYREWPVDRPGIACVWSRSLASAATHRIVPDGCADVIWERETGRLFVAGPDTAAQLGTSEPGTMVGLRFEPGAIALGVPADELRDGRIDLDAFRRDGRELAERLGAAEHPHEVLLDAFPAHVDPMIDQVRDLAERTGSVRAIADAVGLGERQLRRRSLAAFGYGPKVLHRVLRFDRAVRRARAGQPFADVAYREGYTDQAHLAREVKALAGTTLTALTGRTPPTS
ncbi:AraC-type DNA-binding protein [Actinokineospora alba]|uniref:AraC-type DNA-binding protein n=1 Tax=Actinokineospora alba TaxID=504798 RepID=A0A1H0TMU1_9PSEU|nr:AraC family transcriptional regulator [Actinokineospora alba]TDP70610.1 AraC-like DNA-binding protein [Actinokineospora alba]SDJ11604.1 AraC-type DNA-binding protein [Actinokineospora alba]SDP55283.1 AraC-type DNA-binding protein [Actinokineospora alba]